MKQQCGKVTNTADGASEITSFRNRGRSEPLYSMQVKDAGRTGFVRTTIIKDNIDTLQTFYRRTIC